MKRFPTHLLALLGGAAIALTANSMRSRGEAGATGKAGGDTTAASSEGVGAATSVDRQRSASPAKRGENFREAWKLLAARKEPIETRIAHQQRLLAAWAEVDLAGALDAAMAEAWDNEHGGAGDPPPLVGAFRKAFAEDPLGAWKLIQSGRYGVGSQLLRKVWINAVGAKDGPLVVSLLDELPKSLQRQAIEKVIAQNRGDSGKLGEILSKIASFPPGADAEQWLAWASFTQTPTENPSELLAAWSSAAPGNSRSVTLYKWAASLRMTTPDKLDAIMEEVPAAAQVDAAKALLTQLRPGAEISLSLLDQVRASGDWDFLAKHAPDLLYNYRGSWETLRDWTMALPDRPEAGPIINRALDRITGGDPEEAREWIEAMPADDRNRDRALASYVRSAIQILHDREEADWALGEIRDPVLKEDAAATPVYSGDEDE